MRIKIFPLEEALKFVPENKTYAIRIFSTEQKPSKLIVSQNYIHIAKYIFDEDSKESVERFEKRLGPVDLPTTFFTEEIAKPMIGGYMKHQKNIETLLIHCVAGISRSGAIAKAFNDTFQLEQDNSSFTDQNGNLFCPHIYEAFTKTAKKMKVGIFN